MQVVNRRPQLFYASIVSFYVSSLAIAFMPMGSVDLGGWRQSLAYVLAAVFWLGIFAGAVMFLILGKRRRWDRKYKKRNDRIPDAFRFFSNVPAVIFDCIMVAGVIMVILTMNIRALPMWLMWESIFIAVLGIEMHLVFNGETFRWLRMRQKRRRRYRSVDVDKI